MTVAPRATVGGGLDPAALVAGRYDVGSFVLGAKTKTILAGGRVMQVEEDHEKCIVLPNGHKVRVHRSAHGFATHVEENDRLHAVARPNTYRMKLTRS